MSGAEEAARLLAPELARLERLLVEAACSQFERQLDAAGRSPMVTAEQRGLIERAAKKALSRSGLDAIIALIPQSDDEIRSRLIDKIGGTISTIIAATMRPVPHA